jgi:hypothetical protein
MPSNEQGTEDTSAYIPTTTQQGRITQSYPVARLMFVERGKLLPRCCSSCTWWKPHNPMDPITGDCRKRAPELQPAQAFPVMNAADTCQEFKRYYSTEEWDAVKAHMKGQQ